MKPNGILKDVTIGPCRLILGDCLEVLPMLNEKSDLAVSDPPYLLTSGGNAVDVMGGLFSHSEYTNDGELMDTAR